jgi:hypothetical protein
MSGALRVAIGGRGLAREELHAPLVGRRRARDAEVIDTTEVQAP